MSDLISRQAVIERIEYEYREWGEEYDILQILGDLEDFPSAEPKKGKWMPYEEPWYQCSECGAVREQKSFMENFCPNCGSDMRGEE